MKNLLTFCLICISQSSFLIDDVEIRFEREISSLIEKTSIGDVVIYESDKICSGCVKSLSTLIEKVQVEGNVHLMSHESSSQALRFRVNDWGQYLKFPVRGWSYDSTSLSINMPSPVILLRHKDGFELFDDNRLFEGSTTNIKEITIRNFIKTHRKVVKKK
jgi:hypothetical protein